MDIENVLRQLERQGLIRLGRVVNNYQQVYCPFHKDGREEHASCGVALKTEVRDGVEYREGFFHCFTCGYAGSLTETLNRILKKNKIDKRADEWLKEIGETPEEEESIENGEQPLISRELYNGLMNKYTNRCVSIQDEKDTEYVGEEELEKYRYIVDYMFKRGLTEELIEKYDIGYDENYVPEGQKEKVPCITFPIRDKEGRCLWVLRRSIKGKRFFMPAGVKKEVYGIYELPDEVKRLTICESCFNAITSVKYGRSAVALLGTGTQRQIEEIKRLGIYEYILAMDDDEAGNRAIKKIKKALGETTVCWRYRGMPRGKDINDLTEREFSNLELEIVR